MGIFDKAKDLLNQHDDKADQGVDKLADVVDEKTGQKYGTHIDQGAELAKDRLDDFQGPGQQPPATT